MTYLDVCKVKQTCTMVQAKDKNLFSPRIVGGDMCEYEKYPFAVAIFTNVVCGGTIISKQWVLTAAHCIKFRYIHSGRTLLRTGFSYNQELVQRRFAIKAICHEKFNIYLMGDVESPELRYDIALILSNKPFKENKYLQRALLPEPGFTNKCAEAIAVGVGHTEPRAATPKNPVGLTTQQKKKLYNRTLRCVELPIVDLETCRETWPTSVLDSTIICTRVEEGGRDACGGDSGGGLFYEKTVIGIISSGRGCAMPKLAATYTKVESYLDFIEYTMKRNAASQVIRLWARELLLAISAKIVFYCIYK
ncbi:snake venom serine protease KN3-like [Zophobas morio]|uniref:snake venom serine protease KN3-like n=1 Tax=Zophobas morio TaxID=2755281 RepID=UPI003082C98F